MGFEDIVGNQRLTDFARFNQREAEAALRRTQATANAALIAHQTRRRQADEDEAVERAQAERVTQSKLLSALSELSAEQAQTLAALSKASAEQVQTLAAMRKLSEDLASERRRSAAREDIQQGFNRRMSWAALLLAGAAVVVPFGILLIEQGLR